jgi:hypothetical protein
MNATMAIMAREVMARRELLLMAVAVAIMISLLPFLPNIETYEATDVRAVGSSVTALALGCVLALLFGATVFGNDLSEGRLGFFFARPVSGLALWWGRVLAVMALVWIVEIIVLAPALYGEGIDIFASSDGVDWLTILGYFIAPLLLFLLAHAVSIMARARTPWLILDMGGALAVAMIAWLNLRSMLEIGAPIALWVTAGSLIAALLIALSIGGASGVAVGRVDLKRTHSALSLALWGTLAVSIAAITVYGSWLRDFGPRDFDDVEVMGVTPDGGWVEVVGQAKGRLDVRRRYLVSASANRWLPLPARGRGLEDDAVYSLDGSAAIWRGSGPADEPRTLWWVDLGRSDPMARPTNLVVSPDAALTLSIEGALLAILEKGTLSIYELEDERLVTAVRLPAGFDRVTTLFSSEETLRLFVRVGHGDGRSLLIVDVVVASGEIVPKGKIKRPGDKLLLMVDGGLQHMVVWTRSEDGLISDRNIYDANDGSFIRKLTTPGLPRFLQDGRLVIMSEDDDGGMSLVVESVEGRDRILHSIGGAGEPRLSGEAVLNGVVVSRLENPSDRTQGLRIDLLDVDSGEMRNIGRHLRLGFPWLPLQYGSAGAVFWFRDRPEASRLFLDQTGALLRWNPETGGLAHVVGGAK